MKAMDALLTTDHLAVGFPKNELFRDLNLSLHAGKLVCFMGPNGIGKSSLIRTLAGLQSGLEGKVFIMEDDQRPITHKLATVLTGKIPLPPMRVVEFVRFGRYPYLDWALKLTSHDAQLVSNAMELLAIKDLSENNVQELSDGQFQMVMIARALCQETPIILLDEPTAHLDLNNRLEIMKHLKKFAREMKKAILVSTHELDLALQISDEVWLASREKTILRGTPEDLVLKGAFDEIFQFKGFDLRTGRIAHPVTRRLGIQLIGAGHDYLWTKNALERCGFEVQTSGENTKQNRFVAVSIIYEGSEPRWFLKTAKQQFQFLTIADLTEGLISNDCETHE